MWQALGIIVLAHIVAPFIRESVLELPALIIIALLVAWVTWKNLHLGMLIAFTELFVGGHGHLLDVEILGFSLSLRIMIFLVLMAVWGLHILSKRAKPVFHHMRDLPWLLLGVAVLLGTIIGFMNNDAAQAFDDMNGFLMILYLFPMISIKWTPQKKQELLQILAASVLWLTGITLLLAFLFTHLGGNALHEVYTFVRDARLAEITLQTVSDSSGTVVNTRAAAILGEDGYWYRIFMQSQFYLIVGYTLLLSAIMHLWREQRLKIEIIIATSFIFSAILASMSRSFILALIPATLLVAMLAIRAGKKPLRNIMKRSVSLIVAAAIGLVLLIGIIVVPPRGNLSGAAFYDTSADSGRELAISSRWQLLGPMMKEIAAAPVLGSGFGKEVSFVTDDPRIRAETGDGLYTTYRFEWGYQDIWLKMGLLGLFAFIVYGIVMTHALIRTWKVSAARWIIVGLYAGIIALFIANIFTPFLNHPIGIGYLLFSLPFFIFSQEKLVDIKKEHTKKTSLIKQMQTAITTHE